MSEQLQFGVYLNTQAPPDAQELPRVYRELLDMVEVLEEAGFDAAFIPEHHQQPDGYLPSPFVAAGAVLARTTRLRAITGVMLLPLWHPMRVAEDVAVLDVLSGGRMELGVGLGLVAKEFAEFGINIRRAVSRYEEQIEILRRAWGQPTFSFAGQHFELDQVSLTPRPPVPPRLHLGGMSDPAIDRAGRLGDGWITDPLHNLETMAVWAERYRAAAAAAGRPAHIWLQRDIYVSERPGDVEEVWAPNLVADWRFYYNLGFFRSGRFNPQYEPWIGKLSSASEITFDRLRDDRIIVGTPEQAVAQLRRWQEVIRPEGICFRFRFPEGPDHQTTVRSLRLFGREVIPALRG